MPSSKWSAFLSLFVVFFSGAVLGAFAYRLYTVNAVAAVPIAPQKKGDTPEEFLRKRLAEMKDRVKADDQQLAQIKQVYNDTREQFEQLRAKMNKEGQQARVQIDDNQVAKIKAILRPDQIPVYEQIRAEHEAARKRHQQEREQANHK
ncbi:MAG TPA: hypothetical protein VKU19_04960 [Bryobacteraceae bacterium]|nr:hypothetical protein [Bryobacteraceae bacterium]